MLISFGLGFVFGFVYRTLLKLSGVKKIKNRSVNNIGKFDRGSRYLAGVVLLGLGYYFQSLSLLFFSGFCFFEAIFSWCGFYALIGRNTCEI